MYRENDEALQLGRQLRQLFDNCGWSVDWRLVQSPLQEKEIVVRLPTADRLSKAHSALVDSLNEIGLSPVLATSDEVPKNEAILAIGSLGFAREISSNSSR